MNPISPAFPTTVANIRSHPSTTRPFTEQFESFYTTNPDVYNNLSSIKTHKVNQFVDGKSISVFLDRSKLINQIEYYFSEKNLKNDYHIKAKMDSNGFVGISDLLKFPRMTLNFISKRLLLECAIESENIEVFGEFVRSSQHWWKFASPIPYKIQPLACAEINIPEYYKFAIYNGIIKFVRINATSIIEKTTTDHLRTMAIASYGKVVNSKTKSPGINLIKIIGICDKDQNRYQLNQNNKVPTNDAQLIK